MKRGEIWSAAGGEAYAGKPRPIVIAQSDDFPETDSIVVCGFTTTVDEDMSLFRPLVLPSERNRLRAISCLMADKIVAMPRTKLGRYIGRLDEADIAAMNDALLPFLALQPAV